MSVDTYSEAAFVEPLIPVTEPEAADWTERVITAMATATGVLVVATIAVVMGLG